MGCAQFNCLQIEFEPEIVSIFNRCRWAKIQNSPSPFAHSLRQTINVDVYWCDQYHLHQMAIRSLFEYAEGVRFNMFAGFLK